MKETKEMYNNAFKEYEIISYKLDRLYYIAKEECGQIASKDIDFINHQLFKNEPISQLLERLAGRLGTTLSICEENIKYYRNQLAMKYREELLNE